jgi:hypothetical protein
MAVISWGMSSRHDRAIISELHLGGSTTDYYGNNVQAYIQSLLKIYTKNKKLLLRRIMYRTVSSRDDPAIPPELDPCGFTTDY